MAIKIILCVFPLDTRTYLCTKTKYIINSFIGCFKGQNLEMYSSLRWHALLSQICAQNLVETLGKRLIDLIDTFIYLFIQI